MNAKTKRPAKAEAAGRGRCCPICGKPSRPATRPFCSQRCAERDLARWLGGAYRIPTEDRPGDDLSETAFGEDDGEGAPLRRH
jgi:endogenous inhibitor of DNA gyrase (YacG/DUF329 family)